MSDDRAHLTPQPPSPSGADDAPSGEGGSTATAPLSPADRAAQGRRKDTNGEGAGEGARIPPGGAAWWRHRAEAIANEAAMQIMRERQRAERAEAEVERLRGAIRQACADLAEAGDGDLTPQPPLLQPHTSAASGENDDGGGWRPTICIDLDGTLAEYHGWTGEFSPIGDPLPGAWEFCQELRRRGWRIIIHTCRGNVVEVANWLIEHGIEHDGINCSAHNAPGSSAKPIADVYLDDRAIRFEGSFDGLLERIDERPWWEDDGTGEAPVLRRDGGEVQA